ncbi:hypothetical protein RRG08_021577 [Elysia crispata]|uniref:Uncharacterized protein n=1 Tax=Elysia crispata TaxID=231223 RepID=A0AAE0XDV6_9GAST|nr:hypothetical protein RRG08_021577 [Elysia crispata]
MTSSMEEFEVPSYSVLPRLMLTSCTSFTGVSTNHACSSCQQNRYRLEVASSWNRWRPIWNRRHRKSKLDN